MTSLASATMPDPVDVTELHKAHPKIRAEDWRSPLVYRLLGARLYRDGLQNLTDSHKTSNAEAIEQSLHLKWQDLRGDFEKCLNTYQEHVLTEFAALGLACILLTERTGLEITEVTRLGEKVDYWLGERELLLEVGGRSECNLDKFCANKADEQLLKNPYGADGYVCVFEYQHVRARLWFYSYGGHQ